MRYVLIDPFDVKIEFIDAPDISAAYARAKLSHGGFGIDHGSLTRHLAIAVAGDSLLVPPHTQRYFQLGEELYGGRAIMYAVDDRGETIDLTEKPMVVFFGSPQEVENAIQRHQVRRPMTLINGVPYWEWKPE